MLFFILFLRSIFLAFLFSGSLNFGAEYVKVLFFLFLGAEILVATSAIRPRADVAYCIHALSRRLAKTHNWTVS